MRSLSTLLLFCLLCPWSYADQRSEVEAFQLENGMGVLLKLTEQRRHVSIRLVVGVGFADSRAVKAAAAPARAPVLQRPGRRR